MRLNYKTVDKIVDNTTILDYFLFLCYNVYINDIASNLEVIL